MCNKLCYLLRGTDHTGIYSKQLLAGLACYTTARYNVLVTSGRNNTHPPRQRRVSRYSECKKKQNEAGPLPNILPVLNVADINSGNTLALNKM